MGIWTDPLGVRSIRNRFQKNYGYIEFVTTPGAFNLNFPKNHDCDDLGKAITKILNLMCSNGPGWWLGAQKCLERDLDPSESFFISKIIIMSFSLAFQLNKGQLLYLIVGYEVYICWVCLIEKLIYFIHIDQDLMDSNPKRSTARWYSLIKDVRIVIKPVLETQNGVYTWAEYYRCDA